MGNSFPDGYQYTTISNGPVILGIGEKGELGIPYEPLVNLPIIDPLKVNHTAFRIGTGWPYNIGSLGATEDGMEINYVIYNVSLLSVHVILHIFRVID